VSTSITNRPTLNARLQFLLSFSFADQQGFENILSKQFNSTEDMVRLNTVLYLVSVCASYTYAACLSKNVWGIKGKDIMTRFVATISLPFSPDGSCSHTDEIGFFQTL